MADALPPLPTRVYKVKQGDPGWRGWGETHHFVPGLRKVVCRDADELRARGADVLTDDIAVGAAWDLVHELTVAAHRARLKVQRCLLVLEGVPRQLPGVDLRAAGAAAAGAAGWRPRRRPRLLLVVVLL